MNIKEIWHQYTGPTWEKKMLWTAGGLSLLPIALSLCVPSSGAHGGVVNKHAEVDTYIPKGFVLVPIEVQNYEALDSILGQFGLVDLFQAGGPENPTQRLVARNVRMLRAPQNPSHFAVLVQESEVAHVLKSGGLFIVIVKRPDKVGTEFVKDNPATSRTIVYEGE